MNIPDGARVDYFAPSDSGRRYGYEDFRDLFQNRDIRSVLKVVSPLVVVNDGYRHTPTRTILDWLNQIDQTFLDRAHYLVSTGAHAAPTAEHYKRIFGDHHRRIADRISYHDAGDLSSMTRVGEDRFGKDVWLNTEVLKAEQVVVIGSVEPHYFAGYTGGRKSIFPGLTDLATIERNHNLANSLEAAPLRLAGNPVAEHLEELMELTDQTRFFGIQVVTDARQRMAGVFCGPLSSAFEDAAGLASSVFTHTVDPKYDAVLCELLPPLDSNLYQVQKALENCQAAVADGGSAIVVAACEEGVGSDHFFNLAAGWDRDKNVPLDGRPAFGSHKLSRVNAMSKRIGVRLHSALAQELPRRVFFEPVDDIDQYLNTEMENRQSLSLAVVHDAGHTILKTN